MNLDQASEKQIDELCLRFEDEIRDGTAPTIEAYLQRADSRIRERLIRELLLLEWEYADCEPDIDSLCRRFPDYEFTIRASLGSGKQTASLLQLGTQIGRYVIHDVLGSGSFGTVYKAWDEPLQRWVAIKSPRRSPGNPPERAERFVQEAASLAQLKHRNVLAIYDVLHDDRLGVLLVLEYVTTHPIDLSGELNGIISRLIDVADAMDYVHRQGIVHRDLKPDNILIDADDRTVVVDFGLASFRRLQKDAGGNRVGTPRYMSPELVSGHSHWTDGRTDIWSLGIILYEAICGRSPFDVDDRGADKIAEAILSEPVRPPRQLRPECPKQLEEICLRCLRISPEDRYATAGDLARQLRHFLHGPQRQRLLRRTVSLVCCGGVAVLLWCIFSLPWNPTTPSHSRQAVTTALFVHRDGQGMELPEAQPIHDDDRIAIQVEAGYPIHMWVVWIGVEGDMHPWYPNLKNPTTSTTNAHEPMSILRLPPNWKLSKEPSGTATVLILGADPKAKIKLDIPNALRAWQPQRNSMLQVMRFDFGQYDFFMGRGIEFDSLPESNIDSTILINQKILAGEAFQVFSLCRAICIPVVEKDSP